MRTAVLGAGALGLTVAYRLAQRGEEVVVLEREPIPGGLAAGFEVEPGMWLEKFYHHLFRGDRHAIGLIDELGLGDGPGLAPPADRHRCGTAHVHQLDSPMSLLRFTPAAACAIAFGWAQRWRTSRHYPSPDAWRARPQRTGSGAGWARHAYDVVWGPLLRGKFGATADEIAMPWFWARVHDRTPQLGYLRGGFQRLYDRLAQRIGELGGELRLGHRGAGGPDPRRGRLEVETAIGALTVDRVVSTLAVRLTCRLVPELPDDYRRRHEWGQAYGAHCLVLSLDRPLTDSYWMNVNDPGFPFMALVEHTNYMRCRCVRRPPSGLPGQLPAHGRPAHVRPDR